MKRVFSSFNQTSVHHARNLLAAEGIPSEVKNLYLSSAMGELPPAECQAELWVLEDADAPRAESILFRGNATQYGPAWHCPTCNEPCEAQFTQCWKCGALRAA